MEDTVYIGVRVPRDVYKALVARQKQATIEVSLSAVIRDLLRTGLAKANGKRERK